MLSDWMISSANNRIFRKISGFGATIDELVLDTLNLRCLVVHPGGNSYKICRDKFNKKSVGSVGRKLISYKRRKKTNKPKS